jgi:hypothetical protein
MAEKVLFYGLVLNEGFVIRDTVVTGLQLPLRGGQETTPPLRAVLRANPSIAESAILAQFARRVVV